MTIFEERRLKAIRLPERWFVHLFNSRCVLSNKVSVIDFYKLEGVPEDSVVLSVSYEYQFRSLYITVAHPSFDSVSIKDQIPVINGVGCERIPVRVKCLN